MTRRPGFTSTTAGRFLTQLRDDRRARVTVAIALVINVLALALYLWSRGGQTTHVRVETRGSTVSVSVDGQKQIERDVQAPATGGVTIVLADTDDVPTLPEPRGLDRVVVTDLASGETLLADDFDKGIGEGWGQPSGAPTVRDGIVGAQGTLTLATGARPWTDYAVDVTVRNVRAVTIATRVTAGRGAVSTVRPFWWNDDVAGTVSLAVGAPNALAPGEKLRLSRAESLRSLTAMALRPYPYVLALLAAGAVLAALLALAMDGRVVEQVRSASAGVPLWLPVSAVAWALLALMLRQAWTDRANFPFVPDALAYTFQAKIFASGRVTAPPPPVPEAFSFFDPAPFVVRSSSWASQFPFGHPLALVPGVWMGAIWLVPPFLAAGSVALIALVGARAFGARVALLAAVLLATSPFFLMNINDLMSHNTAVFYLLASLALVLERRRQPALMGVAAGLLFGLFFNTRPLAALALAPPFALLLLDPLRNRALRRDGIVHVVAFGAGGLVMLGAFLLYNHATTGDYLRTGYQATGVTFFERPVFLPDGQGQSGIGQALGAGGRHDSAVGIGNERVQLGLLLLVLHGWPAYIGLAFVLLPFLLGTRNAWDWWLLLAAALVTGAWVIFESTGVMYGPRYWLEAVPFLMLLAARGAERAADVLGSVVQSLRSRAPAETAPPALQLAARTVVFAFVAALVISSVYSWVLGRKTTWRADFVPPALSTTCCVLGLDDRIAALAEQQQVHNALVLVEPCATFVCYGSVFWRNNPDLDGDVVWAKDIPEQRDAIIAAFPGRAVYRATYEPPSLMPLAAGTPMP